MPLEPSKNSVAQHGDSLAPIDVREVLAASPTHGRWKVSRARSGWSGRSFVAGDGTQRLFVKFDVAVSALRRLAELGISPPVLHAGEYRDHSFVVQPFVGGRHPRPQWFEGHLKELAQLVGTYHRDVRLRELMSRTGTTHQEHVTRVIDDLEHRARGGTTSLYSNRGLMQAIDEMRRLSRDLRPTELVATHGDPNLKNFILTETAYLIDWDDLTLSDPLRDIGQLMWWYVAADRWADFFRLFGTNYDDQTGRDLYWWVAAESLDVAMRLLEGGDHARAEDFFIDFAAALEQRANPHFVRRRRVGDPDHSATTTGLMGR
jgi:aminoglycoside phosphotransferase (APT) family kinase protein